MKAAAALAVVATLAISAPAGAVEREHAMGLDAGGAILMVSDKSSPDIGGSVGVHYTYGLSDAFNLVANAGWSLVALNQTLTDPTTPHTHPTNMTNADVGVAYVLDVLQWVPWGALEAGGYALQGGTLDGVKILPGVAIAVGVDYRLSRSWSIGIEAREHLLFTDTATYPSFLQGLARFEYVWGW
ncbi:MAG TPA: outer membrane beta-barrel protein [Polyangiaceae bacterium]|jgi:hypothetical protein